MASTDPYPSSTLATDRTLAPTSRRVARFSYAGPATILCGALLWNVGAAVLDGSSLARSEDIWGFGFATLMYTFFVGLPIFLLALGSAVVAQLAPPTARGALVVSSGLSAVTGAALGVIGLVFLFTAGDAADAVFAGLTLVTAVVLWMPAWWAWDVLANG